MTGASGGVGSALVQLVAARGARPIAMVGPGKEALVGGQGAERAITRGARLEVELGSWSVDVLADLVGGPQFPDLLKVLRPEGRYVTAGAAGPIVEFNLRTLYLNHLEAIGSSTRPPAAEPGRKKD